LSVFQDPPSPIPSLGGRGARGRYQRLGQNRLVRAVLGWLVAKPFGTLGDTAHPVSYPEVLRMIDGLDGSNAPIAVGPCCCRTAHQGCDHPTETDIVIRTGVEAWTRTLADMSVCRNSTVVPLLVGRVNVSFFCTGGITWGRNDPDHLTSGWPWPRSSWGATNNEE